MERAGSRRVNWRWAWLLAVLAAAAVYPALIWNSGSVAYDAAHVHIYRAIVFSNLIAEGSWYPRWAQFFHYGLGSPVFTFYSPLPYYALDLLARLGLTQPLGWRLLIAAGLFAACLGSYLFVYQITHERWPAIVAGIAYLYAPYVLRNSLERGSTEAFCMFLYPWVLWSLVWLAERPSAKRFLVSTIFWAAAIGTHVLGPLMLAPVAVLLGAVLAWRYRTPAPLLALLAGGLLTAAVWVPIIAERSYVHADLAFKDTSVQPWANPLPVDNLLATPAIYDTARENNDTGDRIGLLQTALLILGLPAALYAWLRGRRRLAAYLFAATLIGITLFLSFTGASDLAWRAAAPILKYLQFRTRLMGLQALAAAVVAGLLLALIPQRRQAVPAVLILGLLILAALPSLYINLRHQYASIGTSATLADVRAAEFKLEGSALTAFGETIPRWRDVAYDKHIADALGDGFNAGSAPLAEQTPGLTVQGAQVRSNRWDLEINAARPATVTLHLLYYPRWQAWIDGQPAVLRPQAGTGFAQMDVPEGLHRVALAYGTSVAEVGGLVLSGLTLIGLIALAVWPRGRGAKRSPAALVPEARVFAVRNRQAPALWLLLVLTGLLVAKVLYVDDFTTWLRCVSTAARVCGADQAVSVAFEGDIRLRGYSLPATRVKPGGELRLDLFWQADRQIKSGQYSFLRLRSAAGEGATNPKTGDDIWVEERHEGPGGFFTTGYLPERLYADTYRITVPPDLPSGEYALEIGWYDVATGDQLTLQTTELPQELRAEKDAILLSGITVP